MLLRFFPYVFKGLWRHRARTMLTVTGTAVALFVFCFVGSVQEGMQRLTEDEDAQRTLIVFQENRFCPTTSRLPEDYSRAISEIPGVQDVVPMQVWTNNCRASLDIIVFNGAPPEKLRQARKLELHSGSWDAFSKQHDAALVGQNVARRRKLDTGDQFTIGEVSVKVAGIFSSAVPAEENLIYTHLQFLQYTQGLDSAGVVTQLEVHLDKACDPDHVASLIDESLHAGSVPTTTRRKGAFQASTLSDLVDLIGFAHWLGYACVGLVLSLVATTTVMSVQDRVAEHAMLQVLGLRPRRIFSIVILESVLMCFAGGLAGIALAMGILATAGMAIGAEGVTIAFLPSLELALTGCVVSIAVGFAAGAIPAYRAASSPIIDSLNAG